MRFITVIFTILLALQPFCLEARIRHKKDNSKQAPKVEAVVQAEVPTEKPQEETKAPSKLKRNICIGCGVVVVTLVTACGYHYRSRLVALMHDIRQKMYPTQKPAPQSSKPDQAEHLSKDGDNTAPSTSNQANKPATPIRPTVYLADQGLLMAFNKNKPNLNDVTDALKDGANPDLNYSNNKGLLHISIAKGRSDLVCEFIKHDADISRVDGSGRKPIDMLPDKTEENKVYINDIEDFLLRRAILQGTLEVIQDLIIKDNTVNLNGKYTPAELITNLCATCKPEELMVMSLNLPTHTPLFWAKNPVDKSKKPNKKIIKLLENAGAIEE